MCICVCVEGGGEATSCYCSVGGGSKKQLLSIVHFIQVDGPARRVIFHVHIYVYVWVDV
jgi:hypothetical protein